MLQLSALLLALSEPCSLPGYIPCGALHGNDRIRLLGYEYHKLLAPLRLVLLVTPQAEHGEHK